MKGHEASRQSIHHGHTVYASLSHLGQALHEGILSGHGRPVAVANIRRRRVNDGHRHRLHAPAAVGVPRDERQDVLGGVGRDGLPSVTVKDSKGRERCRAFA